MILYGGSIRKRKVAYALPQVILVSGRTGRVGKLAVINWATGTLFATCAVMAVASYAAGLPLDHELLHLACVLSAFAFVATFTQKLAVDRQQRAADAFEQAVNTAITQAVTTQVEVLGEAIAEEMRQYGEARAIDATIAAEQRIAGRHQAGEVTLDLEHLRASHAANAAKTQMAKVTPLLRRRG
jgi:hypothetical protein